MKLSKICDFTAKQLEATQIADKKRYMLYGGSRGPGKSYWLRWYVLRQLLRLGAAGIVGARFMLACEDYPSLYDRQIEKIVTEFPTWLGKYRSNRNEFVLKPEYGSGIIALRNLDNPSKYMSAEFAGIAIDELTKNPERTFHTLRGSLRWPGVEYTQFVGATNPAACWVRDYWVEKRLPKELEADADQFAFLAALPRDNPHLSESYWHELETMPAGPLREAWLHGDWYAGAEDLVFDQFGTENFTTDEPDPEKPIEIAIDEGYVDPCAVLFIQRQPTRILVFDEIYHSGRQPEHTIKDIIDRLKIGWGVEDWPLPEMAIIGSESAAFKDKLRRADIVARGGTHGIVDGITHMRKMVLDGNGHRTLMVNSKRCPKLVDEMMAGYKYPPEGKKHQEKPLDLNNHAIDALRMWLYTRGRR